LNVDLIPFSEFEEFLTTAENVCPDPNDTEYFALAFKLKCPL
jgi:predicted nucleic acid-binding protein